MKPKTDRIFSQLLRHCGIQSSYKDVAKKRHRASRETLLALLQSLDVDISAPEQASTILQTRWKYRWLRGVEPVLVAWNGVPRPITLTLPSASGIDRVTCHFGDGEHIAEREIRLDDLPTIANPDAESAGFVTRSLRLPARLKMGYHPLQIHAGPRTLKSLILSAPQRAFRRDEPSPIDDLDQFVQRRTNPQRERGNPPPARDWCCFLPLHALRFARDWGVGDFSALRDFALWAGRHRATEVGVLPLLAAFLDVPFECSPYRPASRMFWNELFLDVEAIPESSAAPTAQKLVASASFRGRLQSLRAESFVDYRGVMAAKRAVLEALVNDFFALRPARFAEYESYLSEHPSVADYAAFRAATERQQSGWPNWPAAQREGQIADADVDPRAKNYHAFVQWQCDQQLTNLRRGSESSNCGLYLDLPIGVDPLGYDVWRYQSSYMMGASAGAPPDAFFSKGQYWGLPPLHPERSREAGHELLRRVLATNMRYARHLRIDHMMGFHRLYCIPPSFPATEGAYLTYPADELYAVAIIESHRHRCELVGENLGTVPPAVDRALERHAITGMWVAPYELEPGRRGLSTPAQNLAAMLNTHDMPPLAGWWSGNDIQDRRELGHIGDAHLPAEYRERALAKQKMLDWVTIKNEMPPSAADTTDPPLLPLLEKIAASPARLVVVNLEDLWLETHPQNVPGTSTERPNWRRKAKFTLEELLNQAAIETALNSVAAARNRCEGEAPCATAGSPSSALTNSPCSSISNQS